MKILQKWKNYIIVYTVLIILLVICYYSYGDTPVPPRGFSGIHSEDPLDRKELLQLMKEIGQTYINVKTKKPFTKHCRDCAVVISSGQLLDKAAGKEIDDASCVIRMNDAPIVGHTQDVGRKTTLRVVCFRSLPFLKDSMLIGRGKTDMVAVWGADNPGHNVRSNYLLKRVLDAYRHSPIEVYSMMDKGEKKVVEVFEKELGINRVDTNTWVSTGVFTMMLAIQICDSVTVYGMVDEDYCRLHPNSYVPYHYYGRSMLECEMYKQNQQETKDGSHRFLSEKSLFRRWAEMFDIKFQYPKWNFTKPNVKIFKDDSVLLEAGVA
ncbi:alpha-N-acetyl-neuraminyl-2,3-beta-galactosyl-1,3-N-acetyl-galactosaminide alpha-2,6-sialyltransferase-like [Asterias rubens]|uniref:alpha-N-acetyl-neuraminyl-2,3-beta-galactosyl-1, 3-N-acetyl-galactosaminide alpha-2,6-sialyltransferase-like n=1 Tax=Asterias rubens TaxID=7604 RepID=UPI0014554CB6|nr:alpha-N-acetyl-neuraminyl-2,3-beta-galactosyl-1,3-N-acetyl-galactosaminide alpha-2,6-sialyltransferase-like [Asterias rubens]